MSESDHKIVFDLFILLFLGVLRLQGAFLMPERWLISMDCNDLKKEIERNEKLIAEIAVIDAKIASLKSTNNWMENARYNQLSCMRGDLCLQLHAARIAASRGRPPDKNTS
ncbi:hypothetical protein [Clostridium sp. D33t1_170424_F3]|uniref:hypothetical protein n=1 Tax=Clostridium sp. D33t1_170424_F3 TaxID=2787099 RepID=UPI0018A9BEFB|nr:hypothetical protein [Clostridium sp. D33t1_170424_F3]